MIQKTFGPLVNRYLRYLRRDIRAEDDIRDAVEKVIAEEVRREPIVLNGHLWAINDSGRLTRRKVRVMQ